jgi:hypothetical protein
MTDTNLAYYLLQDLVVYLTVFALLGTAAVLLVAFLYITHE